MFVKIKDRVLKIVFAELILDCSGDAVFSVFLFRFHLAMEDSQSLNVIVPIPFRGRLFQCNNERY